jgi:photosystem II stability/assembly factor-like uncharacterized protein
MGCSTTKRAHRSATFLLLLLVFVACLSAPARAAVTTSHSGWAWGSPRPQGNTIRALGFSGDRGYAAGALGTVLRTDDGGATWSGTATGTTEELTRLSLPAPGSVVAAGGCETWRSDDAGETFRRLTWTQPGPACPSALAGLAFPDAETGYLALADGSVASTADGGRSGRLRSPVPGTPAAGGSAAVADLAFTAPRAGVAATTGGSVYRTTDGAASWSLAATQGEPLRAVHFATAFSGYAVGDGGTVLRTVDGGLNWAPRPQAPRDLGSIGCKTALTCVATAADGEALLRTTDGANSFAETSASGGRLFAASFASPTRAVAAGERGATVASDDAGATWAALGSSLSRSFTRVRAISDEVAFASGARGAFARTIDGGRTWEAAPVPTEEDLIDISFVDRRHGWALDSAGGLHRTRDGSEWELVDGIGERFPQGVVAIPGRIVLLVGPRGMLRSTDSGESFRAVRGRIVRRAKLFGADRAGGRVFAFGSKAMMSSADRGRTWRKVPVPRKALLAAVDFVTARTGYALGQDGRVWVTRNRGRRWHDRPGTGSDEADGIAFATASRGYLALSRLGDDTRGYLLRTSDGGRSWRPQLVAAGPVAPDGLAATTGGTDYLLAGRDSLLFTHGGGDRGRRSVVGVGSSSVRPRRGQAIRISGRVRGAERGALVLVSRRHRGESVWDSQLAAVGDGGRFSTTWRVSKTSTFVAQWAGDADQAGDGSAPLVVRLRR